jgi:hypothetical protein
MSLVVHIAAGSLALFCGYVALYASKGGRLHRESGLVFVGAMLTMCFFGGLMAAVSGVWATVNVSAAVITAYFVTTSLTTVRPPTAPWLWLHPTLMLVALGVGTADLAWGVEAVANGGKRGDIPAFPYFLFGIPAILGSVGDFRILRSGALRGVPRLTRHLWRMTFALFIAAMSFFFGQADVFPERLRIMPLLALPVVAVLATMLYWLWRVRSKRGIRGIVRASGPQRPPMTSRTPLHIA